MGFDVDFQIEEVLIDAGIRDYMVSSSDPREVTITPKEKVDLPRSGVEDCAKYALYTLRIGLLVTLWWASAIGVTVVIKMTVGSRETHDTALFPFPFALTAVTNGLCGVLSWIGAFFLQMHGASLPKLQRSEQFKLLAIGLIQGVEIGFNNKALEFLPMSSRTMLNSMNVLFMMGTALCWRLERLGWLKALSVLCLTTGGALQGIGSEDEGESEKLWHTHLTGILLMLATMVLGSQRWALTQFVMQYSDPESALGQMPKLRLMAYIMPVTGTVCGLMATFIEPDCLDIDRLRPELVLNIVMVAAGVVALSFAELKLVHLTSAVAVQVLANIHQIPIVLAGVVFFHDEPSLLGVCGFGLCLGGALVYVLARRAESNTAQGAGYGGLEEEELVGHTLYGSRAAAASPAAAARGRASQADEDLTFEELPVMSASEAYAPSEELPVVGASEAYAPVANASEALSIEAT